MLRRLSISLQENIDLDILQAFVLVLGLVSTYYQIHRGFEIHVALLLHILLGLGLIVQLEILLDLFVFKHGTPFRLIVIKLNVIGFHNLNFLQYLKIDLLV
jgi:hypothetical protein